MNLDFKLDFRLRDIRERLARLQNPDVEVVEQQIEAAKSRHDDILALIKELDSAAIHALLAEILRRLQEIKDKIRSIAQQMASRKYMFMTIRAVYSTDRRNKKYEKKYFIWKSRVDMWSNEADNITDLCLKLSMYVADIAIQLFDYKLKLEKSSQPNIF